MNKPYSQACENNKQPILSVIKEIWKKSTEVVEIGSGTGQHAVFFAENLPYLTWQPTDQAEYLPGIYLWLEETHLPNLRHPLALDVNDDPWPIIDIYALFSANTLHIMSWESVQIFYKRLGIYMQPGALFCNYGPFNKGGTYTSESNARFDLWLKQQDPVSAIRHMEDLVELAREHGIDLIQEIEMPANNKILIWQKN